MKPRASRCASVIAAVVSDATSFEILGLNARQFRNFLRDAQVPNAKIGRRTVARLDRILDALDRLSGTAPRRQWDEAAIVELASRGKARAS